MTAERLDIVVIGGGPAGSSLAIRLAAAGRKVLLAEKASFPRHKLCGEFVSPECLRQFNELGVEQRIGDLQAPRIANTVFYSVRGTPLTIANHLLAGRSSHSIGLSRAAMDDLLLQRAADVGVDVRRETAFRAPLTENNRLTGAQLRSKSGEVYSVGSPIVIDATGRGRAVARSFERNTAKKAKLIAFKTHLRNAKLEKGACEIYSYPGGYGGCTEIESGLFNLCFIADARSVRDTGSEPEAAVREIVMSNARARQALQGAVFVGDWYAVPIARFGRESLVPFHGVIAVGDAAAFIDPFTGSGIALALESAKIASDAIVSKSSFEEIASQYNSEYRAAFQRRLRFCKILRVASTSPLVAEAMITLLAKSSYLSNLFARATRSNALRTAR